MSADTQAVAQRDDELARQQADLAINEMKRDGSLARMELDRAIAEQVRWGDA